MDKVSRTDLRERMGEKGRRVGGWDGGGIRLTTLNKNMDGHRSMGRGGGNEEKHNPGRAVLLWLCG